MRFIANLLAVALVLTLFPVVGRCGVPTLSLRSSRGAALNDGRDTVEVIAEVRDSAGRYVPDGTSVTFTTNLGTFAQAGVSQTVQTRAGTARARISAQVKGTATVTAVVDGGGFARYDLIFTDDPEDTFEGNAYLAASGAGSLLYSATDRVIEALGEPQTEDGAARPGAHITYRNIEVTADSLQVDCGANVVRASGRVKYRRGARHLDCARLFVNLQTGDGFAVAGLGGRLVPGKVNGRTLELTPTPGGLSPAVFEMVEMADASLVVSAQQILLFPGEKLQFKRPHFYQEGQHLLSLSFYSLSLYSNQLFTDQFLSVGTQGLGVDVPLYYDMTPASVGLLRVRYGEHAGRSIYARRPGWALDLTQAYNSLGTSRRFTGEFGLTGINRSDWGFRWSHNQEFGYDTRTSFYVDMPQHRGIYASSNLNRRLGPLNLGLNLSANRSFSGIHTEGAEGDLYLETTPRKVGRTGYMMAVGANGSVSRTRAGDYRSNAVTQGIQARFYSQPFKLDRSTTLTNYVTVGNVWTNLGRGGRSLVASLTAARSMPGGASLRATYDFARQPTVLTDGGSHRVSLSYYAGDRRWNVYVYSSVMLDAPLSSTMADLGFVFAPRWRLSLTATLQRFSGSSFRDFELGIARTIGGRDLLLSYSTLSHRIFFDIQASRF
ncbi:MAG: hypothetical protein IT208_14425 [Chthonomonadales bacterium]|nr:hypothetical protein [Chthonomonadales bacterium]